MMLWFCGAQTSADETLNFVLIDGTWNNSAAMFRRLKVFFRALVLLFTALDCPNILELSFLS